MNADKPLRGEVWYLDFNPVRGHEQGEKRPALIVSADTFNAGPAGLVTVVPITTTDRRVRLHVAIQPPEGGLKKTSYAMPEQIRTVSKDRLSKGWGTISDATLAKVEDMLRVLLDL